MERFRSEKSVQDQTRGAAARSVAPACVALYLAVVAVLLLTILRRDDHVFTYTLDDPYIHLALAENIAHGHYGINAGEASSPSSSIVWPFLLTPAMRWEWGEYLPLGLNVLFCGMAAWWIGHFVTRTGLRGGAPDGGEGSSVDRLGLDPTLSPKDGDKDGAPGVVRMAEVVHPTLSPKNGDKDGAPGVGGMAEVVHPTLSPKNGDKDGAPGVGEMAEVVHPTLSPKDGDKDGAPGVGGIVDVVHPTLSPEDGDKDGAPGVGGIVDVVHPTLSLKDGDKDGVPGVGGIVDVVHPTLRDRAAKDGAPGVGGRNERHIRGFFPFALLRVRMADGKLSWLVRFAMAVALMLVANLVGLTFVGMEHGLQVLIAVVCAVGLAEAYAGRAIPATCLWAAALGPMVRYEDFALVAAVCLVLVAQGRRGTAMRLGVGSVAGPAAFSVFLISRGLPMLPTSVLVKARAYSMAGPGKIAAIQEAIRIKYVGMDVGTMREYAWWALFDIAALLVYLAVREKQPVRRGVLCGALLTAGLQLAVGQFNWFHRYEVYAVAFTVIVAATAVVDSTRVWRSLVVAGVLAVAFPYAQALWQTPAAASNVYQQQYQMHRFVADFYKQPVAVNDLGWVSYRRPAGVRVLDLWGLASPEASRQTNKDAGWLDMMTEKHGIGLAVVYPDWYMEGAPDEWDPLATMCITSKPTSVARPCVVFYSTAVGNKAVLTEEIAAFARTLPNSVRMTLGRDASDEKQ